jgi:hypothetical protein
MVAFNKLRRSNRFKLNKASLEFRTFGLKPNTVYSFIDEYDEDLNQYTQQVLKGENYNSVFSYYQQNVRTFNLDIDGINIPASHSDIHNEILFNDYNYSALNTKIDNVIEIGEIGDPLKTDENGMLAFYYYHPDNNNLSDDLVKSTSLKVNRYKDYLFKTYKLTIPDGTHTVNINPGKKLLKSKNIDKTDNSTFTERVSAAEKVSFNLAQTFYVDADAVNNATEVYISSIDLFFKSKSSPDGATSISGITKPGCSVTIVPTKNRIPIIDEASSMPHSRLEYGYIDIDSTNAQAKTKFLFSNLINVKTNTEYAILIKFDGGSNFKVWTSTEGEYLLGTTDKTAGPAGKYIGNYYNYSSSGNSWIPNNSADLKFNVNIARFATNGVPLNANLSNIIIKNNSREYIHFNELNSSSRDFKHNEKVYQVQANATGNISVSSTSTTIAGNGTLFDSYFDQGSDYEWIVIQNAGGQNELREVISVTSNTLLTIDRATSFTNTACKFYKAPVAWVEAVKSSYLDGGKSNLLVLAYSQANSSLKFSNSATIYGSISNAYVSNTSLVDIKINEAATALDLITPAQSEYNSTITFNYTLAANGQTIVDTTPFVKNVSNFTTYTFTPEDSAVFPSRSNEISAIVASGTPTVYANDYGNSVIVQVTPNIINDFISPNIGVLKDIVLTRYVINNDYSNENTKYGNAYSKHITTKVNLEANVAAEDIQVYLNAYRPNGTDLKVFAKIYNNLDLDAFDDKDWTLLEQKSSAVNAFSKNKNDIIEYSFGFAQYPNTEFTSNGYVSTVIDQSNVAGTGTTFTTDYAANDLVKIYPVLFPNNYIVAIVNNVTSNTLLTLKSNISNTSITGSGLKIDKLQYKHQAFNNITTDNVVRYYSSSMTEFDKFNSFKLKIVFLTNNNYSIPFVDSMRAIAVST